MNQFFRIVGFYIRQFRRRYLSNDSFLLLLAIVIGSVSGMSAAVVKTMAHWVIIFLTRDFVPNITEYLYFSLPFLGILTTSFLVRWLNNGYLSKGIPSVMYSILKNDAQMQKRQIYLQPLTAFITVGFGGSAGFEGPLVSASASLAANIGLWWQLHYRERSILIACAAAGVTAANFKAPITGVLFALEILQMELRVANMVPILFASVSGLMMNHLLFGEAILFNFQLAQGFSYSELPYYILLGGVCGASAIHFTKTNLWLEGQFKKLPSRLSKAVVGGSLLGICIFIFPPLFGEGYYAIKLLMRGESTILLQNTLFASLPYQDIVLLLFLLVTALLKTVACSFTSSGGGNGGIWAAFLFMGGLIGYVFSHACNVLFGLCLPEPNYILASMAGVSSGVLLAPLVGIFLALEISKGYEMLLPVMLVSGVSYIISRRYISYSLFQTALVRKGHWIATNKDLQLLVKLPIRSLIEQDIAILSPHQYLGDLVQCIKSSSRNIFAVVDKEQLVGIILLDDVRQYIFSPDLYQTYLIEEIMHAPPAIIDVGVDDAETVVAKFEQTNAWNLPVIDNRHYLGFLSKAKILAAYRQQLRELGE
ncbi:MAG: chloride channel protein [Chitinophagales bacterium]|nr:chloride channel protein [Chitinophagales bacterium]